MIAGVALKLDVIFFTKLELDIIFNVVCWEEMKQTKMHSFSFQILLENFYISVVKISVEYFWTALISKCKYFKRNIFFLNKIIFSQEVCFFAELAIGCVHEKVSCSYFSSNITKQQAINFF